MARSGRLGWGEGWLFAMAVCDLRIPSSASRPGGVINRGAATLHYKPAERRRMARQARAAESPAGGAL